MHVIKTTSALAIVFAIGGCAPAAKTSDAAAPSESAVDSPATPIRTGSAPPPMGKRAAAQPGERVSPVIAFKGAGEGWRIEFINTDGYDHRATLTWNNSQRGEGVLTYQPAPDGSLQRKVLEGRLNVGGDNKDTTLELLENDCTGGDGITHDHSVTVTVSGMVPMRGCGDQAI